MWRFIKSKHFFTSSNILAYFDLEFSTKIKIDFLNKTQPDYQLSGAVKLG